MTVGPEVEAEGDVVIKEIPARRYAVTRFQGLENIGRVWQELVLWFEDSPHRKPPHWQECLEELQGGPTGPTEEWVFDLYLPTDTDIKVMLGDQTIGGETVMGVLS